VQAVEHHDAEFVHDSLRNIQKARRHRSWAGDAVRPGAVGWRIEQRSRDKTRSNSWSV